MPDLRETIKNALKAFTDTPLRDAGLNLLSTLGYASDRTLNLDGSPEAFLEQFDSAGRNFSAEKALVTDWKRVDLLFQLTGEDLSGQSDLFDENKVKQGNLQSYLFFALELTGENYARGKLSQIARQINRLFSAPVMLLIKHKSDAGIPACDKQTFTSASDLLSIAVINRRPHKRDEDKDVLGKVTLIRNISLTVPHRGHLDILADFALPALEKLRKGRIVSFDHLHSAWEEVFNVELLNKRFYRELANWYFWALPQVSFPEAGGENEEKRNATGLIRLLTRLIFCWFIKEKGLVPEELFDRKEMERTLSDLDDDASTYYCAILQNLFFATLNQRMGRNHKGELYRCFISDREFQGKNENHGVTNLYRYLDLFKNPEAALDLFSDVPFLNGGLFECLDREDPDNKNRMIRIDGFTTKGERAVIPNRLFFANEQEVDLSGAYGERKRNHEKARGLLHILYSYKFTIVENTPIDQEIALDPELLGKVFENLLASYNEETKTTARKQTGSFYTPRPIVDYMVDESLKATLRKELCARCPGVTEEDAKAGLEFLFAYTEKEHAFTEEERLALIRAIDACKILDPACGSGAFPMGILHKLVFILGKLDPGNDLWKDTQLAKLDSAPMREELERLFEDNNDDYGRKLYLIENCLYGVDIQPIAIQITKLRFFISLVCDQKTNRNKTKNHGIRPLPNLETKFVAANSLIALEHKRQQLADDLFANPKVQRLEKELQRVRHDYFGATKRNQKLTLQRREKELRKELAKELAQTSFADHTTSEQLAAWDPYDPQQVANFFEPLWMFDESLAEGFDITIGNPPYVRADEQSAGNVEQRQRILESKQYETLWEKWDLFVPFIERGYKLLKPGGVTTMIVSDAYCHSKYAIKSQNWFLKNARILRLDFCGDIKIFDAAVHNVITFFQKANGTNAKPLRRLHREAFGEVTELPTDEQAELTHRVFFPEEAATEKFTCTSLPLDSTCYISKGMVVHANEKSARGEFELRDLVSDSKDAKHPKPFVEGKHLERWLPAEQKWLEWGTVRAPKLFSRPTFPQIYMVPEKAISVDMSAGVQKLRVAYDDAQLFHNHSAWSFVPWHFLKGVRNNSLKKTARYQGEKPPRPDLPKREDLEVTSRRFAVKYLLGVMNSSSARDFLRANRRSNIHLYPDDWKKLPIPDVSSEQQSPVVAVVEEILARKKTDPNADISDLEAKVDELVARLYQGESICE